MSIVPSLLQAIVHVDGEAMVMHAGEKPYVISHSGQTDLSTRGLTLDAVNGIVSQLLPPEFQSALDEFGAVQYELPSRPEFATEHFTVVAARGGNDLWVEIRRRRIPEDDRVPDEFFAPPAPPASPSDDAVALPVEHAPASGVVHVEPDDDSVPPEMVGLPAAEQPVQTVAIAHEQVTVADTPPAASADAEMVSHDVVAHPGASQPLMIAPSNVDEQPQPQAAAGTEPTAREDEFEEELIDLDAAETYEYASRPDGEEPQEPAAVELPVDVTADEATAVAIADVPVEVAQIDAAEPDASADAVLEMSEPAAESVEETPAEPVPVDDAASIESAPTVIVRHLYAVASTPEPEQIEEYDVVERELVVAVDTTHEDTHDDTHEDAREAEPQPVASAEPEQPIEEPEPAFVAVAEHEDVVAPVAEYSPTPIEPAFATEEPAEAAVSEPPVAEAVEPEPQVVAWGEEAPVAAPETIAASVAEAVEAVAAVEASAASETHAPDMAAELEGEPVGAIDSDAVEEMIASVETPTAFAIAPPVETVTPVDVPSLMEPAASVAPPRVVPPRPAPQPGVVLPMSRNPMRGDAGSPESVAPPVTSLEALLRMAAARGASALYLSSETRPSVRVDGEIQVLEGEPDLTSRDVESLLLTLMPERSHEALRTGAATEWICDVEGVGRVRCMSFRDHLGPGGVFRLIPTRSISAEQLGLSRAIQSLATEPEGLVLIAGPRSSGKRTLMAAFVDLINKTRRDHVITIEREINVVHDRDNAFISQREVRGNDDDMLAAARAALREDPDVLVIEELRTGGLMNVALEAASSGHLVVGGFSAHTAATAIDRIIDLYAPEFRPQVQLALADTLRGVVVQVLMRKASGGRVAAREVLLNTPAVASVLAEGKTSQLPMAIEGGRRHGMVPLNDSLVGFVQNGTVDAHEAYRHSPDRPGFLSLLKRQGIDTSFAERLA